MNGSRSACTSTGARYKGKGKDAIELGRVEVVLPQSEWAMDKKGSLGGLMRGIV